MAKLTARGQKSRDQILQTAIRLFAEKGYHGVSVDEIVETAGVNKRMVYHYFGSKERLYEAVLLHEYRLLEVLELGGPESAEEPIDRLIPRIVHAYFDFLEQHPEFPRLILWENLNDGRNLSRLEEAPTKTPLLDLLTRAVRRGKREGTVRRDVDPRFLLISLIGNCLIYSSNRHTLSLALDMDLGSQAVRGKARRQVSRLLLESIRKCP